jgi:tetratricopeptide (TPR) repeat protein
MKLLMLSLACAGLVAAGNIATGAACADKPSAAGAELLASDAASATRAAAQRADDANGIVDTVRHNRYELQRANMSSPRGGTDAELAGKVRQMQSLDLAAKPAAETSASKTATAPAAAAALAAPSVEIDSQTLEKLRQLPTGPSKALAIADSLFGGRRYEAAFAFYEMALKSSPGEDANAWILFQMGNCRRPSDPAGAREYYKRVLADAPDSAWSKAAAAQDKLVEWEQANSPRSLLETGTTRPAAMAARPLPAVAPADSAQPGKAVPPAAQPGKAMPPAAQPGKAVPPAANGSGIR